MNETSKEKRDVKNVPEVLRKRKRKKRFMIWGFQISELEFHVEASEQNRLEEMVYVEGMQYSSRRIYKGTLHDILRLKH